MQDDITSATGIADVKFVTTEPAVSEHSAANIFEVKTFAVHAL